MRTVSLARPASSLSGTSDVLAGYCLAAPALPEAAEAAAVVPLLLVAAFLLRSSSYVFDACFAAVSARARAATAGAEIGEFVDALAHGAASMKAALVFGALLTLGGVFAALGAAMTAGKLPVYVAAFMFLVAWAKAGRGVEMAVLGPLSGGVLRALGLALGMSAHAESVYFAARAPLIVFGLYVAYGALLEAVEQSQREGGRRFAVIGATGGLLGVFAAAAASAMRTPLSFIVAAVGAAFLLARAWPAVTTLVPASVRRLREGASVAACFLAAAICFGNATWRAHGVVLALGGTALVLVVATGAISVRGEQTRQALARETPT